MREMNFPSALRLPNPAMKNDKGLLLRSEEPQRHTPKGVGYASRSATALLAAAGWIGSTSFSRGRQQTFPWADPLWESRWWITPRHGGRGISSALDNNGKNLLTIGRGSSTVLQLLYRVQ
jgi:hypothetical protein